MRSAAADPLGENIEFWTRADDPWQCLATCFEISAVCAVDSAAI